MSSTMCGRKGVTLPSAAERFVIEAFPELRLTPRPSGEPLRLENLARPIDGRWPSHALPRTPLSRLVHPAQRAVAQRLRALARLRNFSHPPKSVWSLGYCRLAFLTFSSSHFDPKPANVSTILSANFCHLRRAHQD